MIQQFPHSFHLSIERIFNMSQGWYIMTIYCFIPPFNEYSIHHKTETLWQFIASFLHLMNLQSITRMIYYDNFTCLKRTFNLSQKMINFLIPPFNLQSVTRMIHCDNLFCEIYNSLHLLLNQSWDAYQLEWILCEIYEYDTVQSILW